jgi:hypothetical protein
MAVFLMLFNWEERSTCTRSHQPLKGTAVRSIAHFPALRGGIHPSERGAFWYFQLLIIGGLAHDVTINKFSAER